VAANVARGTEGVEAQERAERDPEENGGGRTSGGGGA
jgi:hypothetical protein